MKYNLKNKIGSIQDLQEDKNLGSVRFGKWRKLFLEIVEENNLDALRLFIRNNSQYRDFKYFLLSMVGYVQSMYTTEIYQSVLDVIKIYIPEMGINQ